jgi:hypothetical protein
VNCHISLGQISFAAAMLTYFTYLIAAHSITPILPRSRRSSQRLAR